MQPNGPRGTPLFTSINNSRGGGMYFSDDISALGYMVASLVLGKLPWEDCKSEEEIQRMKEACVIDKALVRFPELRSFISAFRTVLTDDIDYAKWIGVFSSLAKRLEPDQNPHFLPKHPCPMRSAEVDSEESVVDSEESEESSKESKKSSKESKKPSKESEEPSKESEEPSQEEESVVDSIEELDSEEPAKTEKAQVVINESPLSVRQSLQRKRKLAIVNEVKAKRIQPPRKCKKCACLIQQTTPFHIRNLVIL